MEFIFEKNVDIDALLVFMAMQNRFVPAAISLGMTANEAFARADWLKKQSKKYITAVADRVVEMENKALVLG